MTVKDLTEAELEEVVFVYSESDLDREFFLECIKEYAEGNTRFTTFTDCMYAASHKANKRGATMKYMHLSLTNQKLYLEAHFFEWSKRQLSKLKPLPNPSQLIIRYENQA